MKRIIAVYGIVAMIIAVSVGAIIHLDHIAQRMESSLDQILQALEQEDFEQTTTLTAAFQQEWEHNEAIMTRYIHHDELDSITGIVARLSALLEYRDISEFAAEIRRLQHLIIHIRDSEMPTLANII